MGSSRLSRHRERTPSYSRLANGHRRQTWILLLSWLILLLIIGMSVALYVIPRPTPQPDLQFVPSTLHLQHTNFCPGDVMSFTTRFTISHPMVVATHIAVLDMTTKRTIPGTEHQIPPRPRPFITSVPISVNWTIPSLPPGPYLRVTGATALHGGSEAAFLSIPFTITADCETTPLS